MLTPWSGVTSSWETFTKMNLTSLCRPGIVGSDLPVATISNLTLHPAPGEEFSLRVDVFDEVFNIAQSSISIQVNSKKECLVFFMTLYDVIVDFHHT